MGSWNFTVTSEQTKRDPEKNVNTLAMKFSHEMKLSEFEDMEDIKIWNDEIWNYISREDRSGEILLEMFSRRRSHHLLKRENLRRRRHRTFPEWNRPKMK